VKLKTIISLLVLSLQFIGIENVLAQSEKQHSWVRRKLFEESLIDYDEGSSDTSFSIFISPVIALGAVNEGGENKIFNTRGFVMSAYVGKKIRVFSRLEESQAELPFYTNNFYKNNNTLPQFARLKAFKTNGVDYTFATGHITYEPIKGLYFLLGNKRNTLGNDPREERHLQVGNHLYPLNYAGLTYAPSERTTHESGLQVEHSGSLFLSANYITGVSGQRDTLFTTSEGLLRKTNGFYVEAGKRILGKSEFGFPDKKANGQGIFWSKNNVVLHFSSLGLGLKPTTDIPNPRFPLRNTVKLVFNNYRLGKLELSVGKENAQNGLTSLITYIPSNLELSDRLLINAEFYYASSTQKQSNLKQAGLYLGLPYVNNAEFGIVAKLALLQKDTYKNRAELTIKANHFLKESAVLGAQQTIDLSMRYVINPSADYAVQAGYVTQKLYTVTEAKPYVYFGFFANINHKPINF